MPTSQMRNPTVNSKRQPVNATLSVESALARMLEPIRPLPTELISLLSPDVDGRRPAQALTAKVPLPGFDNSAMDGYAVRAIDAGKIGNRLEIRGQAVAGSMAGDAVAPGIAVRIFTGAPLPTGADAVIMQEDVTVDPGGRSLTINDPVTAWENVRFQGEDTRPGDVLVRAGIALEPQHIAALLASGWDTVLVHQKPRVALVVSGSELRAAGSVLSSGQIHESNTGMLAALVRRAGGIVVSSECVPDDASRLRTALESAVARADLVLTAGGASVGDHDLVRPALASAGGTLDFWRVSMKPGKPFLHGHLNGIPLYGLPGNPVSAFVTSVLFVLPVLRRLQGDPFAAPVPRAAIWAEDVENRDKRRHYIRVTSDADGRIRPSGPQGSHRLASLAAADGLVDLPPESTVAAGSVARVLGW